MLEFLSEISAQDIQNWIAVIGAIIAAVKVWKDKDGKDKWEHIKRVIPHINDVVQKAARATHFKKDDLFVEKITDVLKPLGWTLNEGESKVVKMLGEGYHQIDKKMRAEGNSGKPGQLSEDVKPLEQEA